MSEVSVNLLTSSNNGVVFKRIAKSSDCVILFRCIYCIAETKVLTGKKFSLSYGAMAKWLGIGFSIKGSWVKNHRVAPTSTKTFVLLRSIR